MPREARPGIDGPPLTALARHDADSQTVTLVLDTATADYAITAHAQEREVHLREVQLHAQEPEPLGPQLAGPVGVYPDTLPLVAQVMHEGQLGARPVPVDREFGQV